MIAHHYIVRAACSEVHGDKHCYYDRCSVASRLRSHCLLRGRSPGMYAASLLYLARASTVFMKHGVSGGLGMAALGIFCFTILIFLFTVPSILHVICCLSCACKLC